MTRFCRAAVWGMVCSWFLISTAKADVAYSTFGSGDSFNSSAYAVGNQVDPLNFHLAFRFSSEGQGFLSSVDVAAELLNEDLPSDSMELVLWSHSFSTNRPDQMLWSGTVDPSSTAGIVSAAGGMSAPFLEFDTEYWLSARSLTGDNYYAWRRTTEGIANGYVHDFNGGDNWSPGGIVILPAFRINVGTAAVPEPGLGLAGMAGLTSLYLLRRKRRR